MVPSEPETRGTEKNKGENTWEKYPVGENGPADLLDTTSV